MYKAQRLVASAKQGPLRHLRYNRDIMNSIRDGIRQSFVIALTLAFAFVIALTCAALSGCTNTESASSSSNSASAKPTPSLSLAGDPALAFERAGDANVTLHVNASVVSDTAEPATLAYDAFVVLIDGSNSAFRMDRKKLTTSVSAEAPRTVSVDVALSPEEFNALAGVRFACFGWRDGQEAFLCLANGSRVYPVEEARQAYIAAEEERVRLEAEQARQQHEAQWRAKFPTDDYSNTILIGDSIMQNCSSALRSTLPGVTIDADAGRSLEYGGLVFEGESPNDGVLDHIRQDDGEFDRYVIGTGNNDAGGVTEEDAEEMIEHLGNTKQIYFVTEYVRGNLHGTGVTNDTIDAMVEKYPFVHKIDWYGLVHENPSAYLKDGCHPRDDSESDYAELLKEGLDVIY